MKNVDNVEIKENYYSKNHIAIAFARSNPALFPTFLPLSETFMEVLFCECLLLYSCGFLNMLNRFKMFTFHTCLYLGERQESAWDQLW